MTTNQPVGPPAGTLRFTAYGLGIFAAIAFLRILGFLAADDPPSRTQLSAWQTVVIVAAVFSAACAVLAGIKSAEARIHAALNDGRQTSREP